MERIKREGEGKFNEKQGEKGDKKESGLLLK